MTERKRRPQPVEKRRRNYEPRLLNAPEPGFWLLKAVKNGPIIPARIFWCDFEPSSPENTLDRGGKPFLAAEIAGHPVDPERVWHTKGEPIDEAEYLFRIAEIGWLRTNNPTDPLANPWEPVRFSAIPLPFN